MPPKCNILHIYFIDAAGKKIVYGFRKAFTICFAISKQPMFAITERLLSKNKSTFSMLLYTHFLKASGNVLQ